MRELSYIEKGENPSFIVEGKPFIALAGELHNSSASSLEYLDETVWPKIDELNLNTVIAPVYWELIEPTEGYFDFSSVRDLIDSARQHKKKLILLWFGLWKNALSTYIPKWMKEDRENYPFAEKKSGEKLYTISPYSQIAVEKDKFAFENFMIFLKDYDEEEQTVIMLQIENEVGILGSDFDYSCHSLAQLDSPIPREISCLSEKVGTWKECFGKEAKEYYLAYHFAKSINTISQAGKQIYNLPHIVNAWLEKPAALPGEYPLGGPTARMYPFWKQVAPSIDGYGPDIYVPNFSEICDLYTANQTSLIVPETRQDIQTVSNFLYAVAKYNLICFSPFAIEDFKDANQISSQSVLHQLAIDSSAFNPKGTYPLLQKAYAIIGSMVEKIVKGRETATIHAFKKEKESERGELLTIRDVRIRVKFLPTDVNQLTPAGFILEGTDNEIFIVGVNSNIELISTGNFSVGLVDLEEGRFQDGVWQRRRVLNGDERYFIALPNEPSILRLTYHFY